jgi:Tol biopolymer transport system component
MEWSEPMRLGPEVNTEAAEIFVSVTDDGTLFFRRSAGENRAIYSARAAGDNFAAPELVQGLELPSAGNPSIARDGSFLIMSGIVEGRASDLFISFSNGAGWTPAKNLGDSINTTFAEFAPSVSPDGKYLFFTSERPGVADATAEGRPPGDIYQIELRAIEGVEWPE